MSRLLDKSEKRVAEEPTELKGQESPPGSVFGNLSDCRTSRSKVRPEVSADAENVLVSWAARDRTFFSLLRGSSRFLS